MAVPIDIKLSVKTYHNLSKYKDLGINISKMCNLRIKIIHVLLSLEVIAKRTHPYHDVILGNLKIAK